MRNIEVSMSLCIERVPIVSVEIGTENYRLREIMTVDVELDAWTAKVSKGGNIATH